MMSSDASAVHKWFFQHSHDELSFIAAWYQVKGRIKTVLEASRGRESEDPWQ